MTADVLEKTLRINMLFDIYRTLLTEKQQTFLQYYFYDDYSLGEIAAEFQISRQAVYEHLKRAEQALEMYEAKLGLLSKQEKREHFLRKIGQFAALIPEHKRSELHGLIKALQEIDD